VLDVCHWQTAPEAAAVTERAPHPLEVFAW